MKRVLVSVLVLALALVFAGQAAAVQPPPAGKARFFDHYQCEFDRGTGYYIELRNGNYPDLGAYNVGETGTPNWHDKISCMVMGPGVTRVIVYEHANYKGRTKTFTKTTGNPLGSWSLINDWWDNKISSLKIQ